MKQATGYIHSMESFGTVDGPGIRFVLFLAGCHLRCLYCHNPDTWTTDGAKEMTAQEVLEKILPLQPFLTGGVTISGGEPLLQAAFCEELIDLCKQNGIHTAIDTSGALPLETTQNVLEKADLILLDIKEFDSDASKVLTGRGNFETLQTLNYLEKIQKPVWIRHVLLPEFTLQTEKLTKLADFLKGFQCVERIELLPFHKMGEFKWQQLGLQYELFQTPEPDELAVTQAREIFQSRGLIVK